MRGHMLCAPDQHGFFPAALNDNRRRVSMIAFCRRLVIARHLPAHLAGCLIERGQPGLAVVHSGHDDMLLRQHRRRAVVPVERVRAEALDQIGLPTDLAIQFQRRESAALEVNKNSFAVRGGRCVAARAVAMLARLLWSQPCLP